MSTTVPKGAKKPTDRKPKTQPKTQMSVEQPAAEVVTVRDREWVVLPGVRDDFEILDLISRLEAGEGQLIGAILRALIGPMQYAEAMEMLRDPETGRVSLDDGTEFAVEFIKALDPNS